MQQLSFRYFTIYSLFAVAFMACVSGTPTGSECDADEDCASGVCVNAVCIELADAAQDVATDAEDAADTSDDAEDATEDTNDTSDDAAGDTSGDTTECERGFNCPCDDDSDCDSRVCIDTGDENVCTELCDGSCSEPGWECRLVRATGGDLIEICVPEDNILCRTCTEDINCGGLTDLCLPQSDGKFCARDCSETECPGGYECEAVSRTQGGSPVTFRQCVPTVGICGDCLDLDDDGYGQGAGCLGLDCDDNDGDTYSTAAELCDGDDNDCDESIDEDFDLMTEMSNCGSCGAVCDPENTDEAACLEGVCSIVTCAEGFADCDGDVSNGCEAELANSMDHCGACDSACALDNAISECVEGACTLSACTEQWGNCDADGETGCETDLLVSLDACGACGAECSFRHGTGTCDAGACTFVGCDENFADCNDERNDGCEVSLLTDPQNCLTCGVPCDLPNVRSHVCTAAGCGIGACDVGFADCDGDPSNGCEVNTTNDVGNCGACTAECRFDTAVAACVDSACAVASCNGNQRNCDGDPSNGCETDVMSDLAHCGICDLACDTTNVDALSCNVGTCSINACDAGFGDCDLTPATGCEQDLSSLQHCRACNNRCEQPNAISECRPEGCAVAACEVGWVDLDGDLSNGCDLRCTPIAGIDSPDPGFVDSNCDGIDGDATTSIFVSPDGNDSANGLTPDTAVATIAQGIVRANSSGRANILMVGAAYAGGTLNLPSGKSLYGGYSANFRSRSATRAVYSSTASVALRIQNISSAINIDSVDFSTPNQGTNGWTAALIIDNAGSHVSIARSNITAGAGGVGSNGSSGSTGARGGNGSSVGNSKTGGAAGSGGGGRGGDGRDEASGLSGAAGSVNNATAGTGGRGANGGGCADGDADDGGNGGRGGNAGRGSSGSAGNAIGSRSDTAWTPSNGTSGGTGGRGGGGGGGGAGGGEDCVVAFVCIFCGTGRGGGGGGGAGGTAGTGGTGGGASIGILLTDSTVNLEFTTVRSSNGGNGGRGGDGGAGGSGGDGGAGGSNSSGSDGDGGTGGRGGDGGAGGCGGGGGGGPSIAIWGSGGASSAVVRGTSVSLLNGSGGSGGSSCGSSGANGVSGSSRDVSLR